MIGVEHERGAVEHQFVLAADLIDVNQRQACLGHARHRDVETDVGLVAPIGRAIRHDQKLGAGFGQALDDVFVIAPVGPGILANRQAEPYAAKVYRSGQRT